MLVILYKKALLPVSVILCQYLKLKEKISDDLMPKDLVRPNLFSHFTLDPCCADYIFSITAVSFVL